MKHLSLLICIALAGTIGQTNTLEFNPKNCNRNTSKAPVLSMVDFPWGQSLEEMSERFLNIYQSGKRLKHRAYVVKGRAMLPEPQTKKLIQLQPHFINSIKTHIETALNLGYAQFVFFSDMGHSHLFVEKEFYQTKVRPLPVEDKNLIYELMFNHKQTRFLYHTAEQLEMIGNNKELLKDRAVQWRFFTRNIVGDNKGTLHLDTYHAETSSHNTARRKTIDKDDKYKYWGSGFSLAASKNGCFSYTHKGQIFHFDISLKDPEPKSAASFLKHPDQYR